MARLLILAAIALCIAACGESSPELALARAEIGAQREALQRNEEARAQDQRLLLQRLDAIQQRLDQLELDDGAPPQSHVELAEIEAALARLKAETTQAVREEIQRGAEREEQRIAEVLARQVAKEQAANAPTKNLGNALDRLAVSDAEKEQVRREITDAKRRILETLEIRTDDGRNLAVEIVDCVLEIQDGTAGQTALHKLFADMAGKRIPGDPQNRTYVEVINKIKQENRDSISRILSEDDQKKLSRAHEDWADFELGDDDPWAALYLERLERFNE